MKKVSFFAAFLAALAMVSCTNKDGVLEQSSKPEFITVNTSIVTAKTSIGALTRVSNNGVSSTFEEGDKISVYSWNGSANEVNTTNMVVNNSINTLHGSEWKATPMMKWTDMVVPHYFIAVYPNRLISDFKADVITIDPTNQNESDIMVAINLGDNKQGLIASSNPVPLQFNHLMSKLVVILSFRNEFGTSPQVTSVTTEAHTSGTVDYLSGVITSTGSSSDFALPSVISNTQFSSIILPQSIQTISIEIDGKIYTYTHPVPLTLESGKIQTIKLIVGRNRIELQQVTINDWTYSTEVDGGEAL